MIHHKYYILSKSFKPLYLVTFEQGFMKFVPAWTRRGAIKFINKYCMDVNKYKVLEVTKVGRMKDVRHND